MTKKEINKRLENIRRQLQDRPDGWLELCDESFQEIFDILSKTEDSKQKVEFLIEYANFKFRFSSISMLGVETFSLNDVYRLYFDLLDSAIDNVGDIELSVRVLVNFGQFLLANDVFGSAGNLLYQQLDKIYSECTDYQLSREEYNFLLMFSSVYFCELYEFENSESKIMELIERVEESDNLVLLCKSKLILADIKFKSGNLNEAEEIYNQTIKDMAKYEHTFEYDEMRFLLISAHKKLGDVYLKDLLYAEAYYTYHCAEQLCKNSCEFSDGNVRMYTEHIDILENLAILNNSYALCAAESRDKYLNQINIYMSNAVEDASKLFAANNYYSHKYFELLTRQVELNGDNKKALLPLIMKATDFYERNLVCETSISLKLSYLSMAEPLAGEGEIRKAHDIVTTLEKKCSGLNKSDKSILKIACLMTSATLDIAESKMDSAADKFSKADKICSKILDSNFQFVIDTLLTIAKRLMEDVKDYAKALPYCLKLKKIYDDMLISLGYDGIDYIDIVEAIVWCYDKMKDVKQRNESIFTILKYISENDYLSPEYISHNIYQYNIFLITESVKGMFSPEIEDKEKLGEDYYNTVMENLLTFVNDYYNTEEEDVDTPELVLAVEQTLQAISDYF